MLLPNHAIPARMVAAGGPSAYVSRVPAANAGAVTAKKQSSGHWGFRAGNWIRLSGLVVIRGLPPLVRRADKGLLSGLE